MPYLDSFQRVIYDPSWPYHYLYDNVPIQNLLNIQQIVNQAVDNNTQLLLEAVGSAGSLAARLDEALNPDGSLKTAAVDATMHTMDDHTDTGNYVRMTADQATMLAGITPGATALWLSVAPGNPPVVQGTFPADQTQTAYLQFQDSESITWQVTPGDGQSVLQARMVYPPSLAIQHYYEITPIVVENNSTGTLFQTTSVATNYIDGSLRVYINGIRIFSDAAVYVPSSTHDDTWFLANFSPVQNEDESFTTFQLSTVIDPNVDVIRVDFDSLYT